MSPALLLREKAKQWHAHVKMLTPNAPEDTHTMKSEARHKVCNAPACVSPPDNDQKNPTLEPKESYTRTNNARNGGACYLITHKQATCCTYVTT